MLPSCKIGLPALFLFFACTTGAAAQNVWLATVNYTNVAVNPVGNIPGLPASALDNFSNTAFDQVHRRYFFQGIPAGGTANHLYTIDAATAAVVYSPACPSAAQGGGINGLQYDNDADTLYAVYTDMTNTVHFAWLDPATGAIHTKSSIPGYWSYLQTAYDNRDHLYIMTNDVDYIVIDAPSGSIVFQSTPGGGIINMVYDNATEKLYGIGPSPIPGYNEFDNIVLSTGQRHLVANLPSLTYPETHAYAIDENAGRYMFVAEDTLASGCPSDTLYVVDVNTGNIISRTSYPYSPITLSTNKFLVDYSFDNQAGILYALNWRPPDSTLIPQVSINASTTTCLGQVDTFTAVAVNGGPWPVYQWTRNGINVGTNAPVYTSNSLVNGDAISCSMTVTSNCAIIATVSAGPVVVTVDTITRPVVIITAPADTICSSDTVVFTASAVDAGAAPHYQWRINGANAGTGSAVFTCSGLSPGDTVDCLLAGSIPCSLPALSNKLALAVKPSPVLYVGNDTVISPGQSVQLSPAISGTVDSYRWAPAAGLSNSAVATPLADPVSTTTYRLTVTAANGCTASGSTTVMVYSPLKMPNAFTPNGDGKNDVFRIPPSTPQKISSFVVFNRWGQQVFASTGGTTGWDGNCNGSPQPSGAYIWMIRYIDLITGMPVLARGTVMLIR